MNNHLPSGRTFVGALLVLALMSACGTGTQTGDTNVERGVDKSHDPTAVNPVSSDSATAGLNRDTTRRVTGKDLYDQATKAKDRNNDGIAD